MPAAGDRGQFIRTIPQLLDEIVYQQIDAAIFPHHQRQRLAADGFGGRKNHRLDPQHPFPPTHRWRQQIEFSVIRLSFCCLRSSAR